jgi:hypothetical protein
MIELNHHGSVAIVTITYGKANALDNEFCRPPATFAFTKQHPAGRHRHDGASRPPLAEVSEKILDVGGRPRPGPRLCRADI